MKKIYILILFILLSISIYPAVKGLPMSDDEYAHMFSGAYIAKICKDNNLEWRQTFMVAIGLGLTKELYDIQSTGFSSSDIAFNVSGVILAYSIDEILFNKRNHIGLTHESVIDIIHKIQRETKNTESLKNLSGKINLFLIEYKKGNTHIRFFDKNQDNKESLYIPHIKTIYLKRFIDRDELEVILIHELTHYSQHCDKALSLRNKIEVEKEAYDNMYYYYEDVLTKKSEHDHLNDCMKESQYNNFPRWKNNLIYYNFVKEKNLEERFFKILYN